MVIYFKDDTHSGPIVTDLATFSVGGTGKNFQHVRKSTKLMLVSTNLLLLHDLFLKNLAAPETLNTLHVPKPRTNYGQKHQQRCRGRSFSLSERSASACLLLQSVLLVRINPYT